MRSIWFKKTGWIYLSVSMEGIVATLFAVALCVWWFIAIDRNSHLVSDTFIHFWVYASITFFWLYWLASNTSEKK